MSNKISGDWIIELGLDTNKAEAKIKSLEARLGRMGGGGTNSRNAPSSSNPIAAQNQAKKQALALDNRRAALLENINQKERMLNLTMRKTAEQQRLMTQLSGTKRLAQNAKNNDELTKTQHLLTKINNQARVLTKTQGTIRKKQNSINFAVESFSESLRFYLRHLVSIYAVLEGGRFFLDTTKKIERANVALINASGSAAQAAKDYKFVKKMANELGLAAADSALAFGKFSSAAMASGMSAEQSKVIFRQLSEAVAANSLDAESAKRAMMGFQQVLSKGKVSMEEVRQQIGEQLPNGWATLAEALGVSTLELDKMISSGKLLSADVIPKWSAVLSRAARENGALAKAVNSTQARLMRIGNTFEDLVDTLNKVGAITLFHSALVAIQAIVNTLAKPLQIITTSLEKLAKMFGQTEDEAGEMKDTMSAATIIGYALAMLLTGKMAVAAGGWIKNLKLMSLFTSALTGKTFAFMRSIIALKRAIKGLLITTGIGALFVLGTTGLEYLMNKADDSINGPSNVNNNSSSNTTVNNNNNVNFYGNSGDAQVLSSAMTGAASIPSLQ